MRKKLFLIFLFLILGFLFVKSNVFIFEFTRKQTMFIANASSEALPTKSVNFTASSSKEITKIYSLSINKPIYSFSVSGNLVLNSESSLVRIILIDSHEDEHLVYEAYPLIVEDNTFSFNDVCEETCLLDSITPVLLKIDLFNATVKINKISFFDDFGQLGERIKAVGIESARKELKETKDNLKIQKINEQIKKKGLKWIAAETSVSKMSYAEKKGLFRKPDGTPVDNLPNLQGFEYYKGGIFEIKSETNYSTFPEQAASSSELPESWDWRNVHGENWNTPVRNQGSAGTCWAFANTGAMESLINLYFNQHLDVDLSEQMHVDCVNSWELPMGMNPSLWDECSGPNNCFPGSDDCVIGLHGLPDEACDPYAERDLWPAHCDLDYICSDWRNRVWKITDFHDYKFYSDRGTPTCPKQTMNPSEGEFKKVLIEKGPMNSLIDPWNHAMVLSGYNGRTNWKSLEYCLRPNFCHPLQGCISNECTHPGEELRLCINQFWDRDEWMRSDIYVYQCKESQFVQGRLEWQYERREECGNSWENDNYRCVDNQCQDKSHFHLTKGHQECFIHPGYYYPRELYEYRPGEGEHYWIFKNSWGTDWGEEGYARVAASLGDLGYGSLPIGPVVPPIDTSFWPANFTNQINCADKDGDGYCNWGISGEKPTSCPQSCYQEKDCDDSNANLGPFDANFNCIPLKACREDVNNDSFINANDLKQVLLKYSLSGSCPEDINEDGLVNSLDGAQIILHWEEVCD